MNATERRNPSMPAAVMRGQSDDLWREFVAATAVIDRVRETAGRIVAQHPDPVAVGAALRILEATR